MSIQLSFTEQLEYDDNPAGITIFVSLGYGEKNLRIEAKVDPGAEVCLFTYDVARRFGIQIETGIPIKEYCKYFDSVSLCLSKSLGAPVGSVLVGDRSFIKTANHFKKQNGGGIRQAGILTSMALVALKENMPKLKKSHTMAKDLAQFCEKNGIALQLPADTNFVFLDLAENK
ncbi:MAG: hypothetical protein KA368_14225, partial [Acidobacteria bacterium]|nr:hypothetical protein [Acidobacteriota bacterium]